MVYTGKLKDSFEIFGMWNFGAFVHVKPKTLLKLAVAGGGMKALDYKLPHLEVT